MAVSSVTRKHLPKRGCIFFFSFSSGRKTSVKRFGSCAFIVLAFCKSIVSQLISPQTKSARIWRGSNSSHWLHVTLRGRKLCQHAYKYDGQVASIEQTLAYLKYHSHLFVIFCWRQLMCYLALALLTIVCVVIFCCSCYCRWCFFCRFPMLFCLCWNHGVLLVNLKDSDLYRTTFYISYHLAFILLWSQFFPFLLNVGDFVADVRIPHRSDN